MLSFFFKSCWKQDTQGHFRLIITWVKNERASCQTSCRIHTSTHVMDEPCKPLACLTVFYRALPAAINPPRKKAPLNPGRTLSLQTNVLGTLWLFDQLLNWLCWRWWPTFWGAESQRGPPPPRPAAAPTRQSVATLSPTSKMATSVPAWPKADVSLSTHTNLFKGHRVQI